MMNELDLHGVLHSDAPREIDKFLGEHLMRGTKTVHIISGNSDRMKQIVGRTLSDYQMTYTESWGNSGDLIIELS